MIRAPRRAQELLVLDPLDPPDTFPLVLSGAPSAPLAPVAPPSALRRAPLAGLSRQRGIPLSPMVDPTPPPPPPAPPAPRPPADPSRTYWHWRAVVLGTSAEPGEVAQALAILDRLERWYPGIDQTEPPKGVRIAAPWPWGRFNRRRRRSLLGEEYALTGFDPAAAALVSAPYWAWAQCAQVADWPVLVHTLSPTQALVEPRISLMGPPDDQPAFCWIPTEALAAITGNTRGFNATTSLMGSAIVVNCEARGLFDPGSLTAKKGWYNAAWTFTWRAPRVGSEVFAWAAEERATLWAALTAFVGGEKGADRPEVDTLRQDTEYLRLCRVFAR